MTAAQAAGHDSYSINGWHRHCRGIYRLLQEPRILDYVEDLIGPHLISTMTHYFCKEPGDEKQVVWHQDASYWPLTPSKVVTVWLAIDDVEEENGPMQFIPGSHHHGQIPFEYSTAEEKNVLGQSVRSPEEFGDPPVSVCLQAGQISIHTDLLLHGSAPNRSTRRRCGLTLRYMPPDVRAQTRDHASAFICRGTDPEAYWQSWPIPVDETIPAARAK
jgi:ectoine hydroxylase-related dioxygenase (phytanoyl-CoA dioxygenase family)